MSLLIIDLEDSNPTFASIKGHSFKSSRVNIPNRSMPQDLADQLDFVHEVLTGKQLDPAGYTFTVSCGKAGAVYSYKRLFPPSLFRDGDNAIILWGDEKIPVSFGVAKRQPPIMVGAMKDFADNRASELWEKRILDIDAILVASKSSRGYDEVYLSVTMYLTEPFAGEYEAIQIKFPVRFSEEFMKETKGKISEAQLNMEVKTKSTAFIQKLFAVPTGGGFNESIRVTDLEIGKVYKVVGYRVIHNENYDLVVLTVTPPEIKDGEVEDGYSPIELDRPTDVTTFDRNIGDILKSSPKVDMANPARLIITDIRVNKRGNKVASVGFLPSPQAVSNTGFNLDF